VKDDTGDKVMDSFVLFLEKSVINGGMRKKLTR
jgi:hypothetical protein